MKRTILTFVAMLCLAVSAMAQSIEVYISDNSGQATNIRNAPKGKVVYRLPLPASNGIMFSVDCQVNGWWHVDGNEYWDPATDIQSFTGSDTGYWVHNSVIAFATRNYGGQKLSLRSKPLASAPVVYSFTKELKLRPLDVMGKWVKVQTYDGKHIGWIELEWICGNSVTNCC